MRGSESLPAGLGLPVVASGAPYLTMCSHSDDCRNKLKKLKTCRNWKVLRRCTPKMNALKSIVVLLLLITAQPSYSRPTVAPQRERREGSGIDLPEAEEVDNNRVLPPVQQNRGEEGEYFQGDIRLRPGEDPFNTMANLQHGVLKRMTVQNSEGTSGETPDFGDLAVSRFWPNSIVPYKYGPSLVPYYRRIFAEAIQIWNDSSCLNFVAATEQDVDYILLTDEQGCSSYVGKKGGMQEVSINQRCDSVGHALHEIGHAIGFWHEHSRRDRNSYIRIEWNNIKAGKEDNFWPVSEPVFNSVPDVGYDLESIMHYGTYAFSIERGVRPTIIQIAVDLPRCALDMGQREQLSYKDLLRVNRLYRCTAEIQELEETVPSCPPITSPTTPPPSPSPSPTPTPSTGPPRRPRISSGSTIILYTANGTDGQSSADNTLYCENENNGCYNKSCTYDFFADDYVCGVDHALEIHLTESRRNPTVKNGDIVVMRSVVRSSKWLDCTRGDDHECTITQCRNNDADLTNSSYVSDCDNHYFKIIALKDGNAVRGTDKILLKHPDNETYLNCQDKKCRLVPYCGLEPELASDRATNRSMLCDPQKFRIELVSAV